MSVGTLTPQQFAAKWRGVRQNERAIAQQHFLDLCALFDQPTPATADPTVAFFTFEKGVTKTGGGKGYADVWMRGHFACEYKGKRKDLDAAYQQVLLYREPLENPVLAENASVGPTRHAGTCGAGHPGSARRVSALRLSPAFQAMARAARARGSGAGAPG